MLASGSVSEEQRFCSEHEPSSAQRWLLSTLIPVVFKQSGEKNQTNRSHIILLLLLLLCLLSLFKDAEFHGTKQTVISAVGRVNRHGLQLY